MTAGSGKQKESPFSSRMATLDFGWLPEDSLPRQQLGGDRKAHPPNHPSAFTAKTD